MLLRGLPTPGSDETLGSWLFRCSVNRHSRVYHHLHLGGRPSSWWADLDLKYADPDIDFIAAVNKLADAGYQTHAKTLETHFAIQTGELVEWNYRHFYCPECLRKDVASGRLPMWQKRWCYEGTSTCILHGRQLDTLIDSSRYSKAWDAFVQHCNTKANGAIEIGTVFSRLRSTTMSMVAKSISHDGHPQHGDLGDLFTKLYRIFLQAPYKGSHGGAARIHFHTGRHGRLTESKSLENSFLMGPSTADSPSRFGSMIFSGALLGIISESRYMMLARAHEAVRFNSLFPRDLHQAAAFPYLDRVGYGVLYDFLGVIPRAKYPLLDRHLQLQEYRYKREGVFDGRTLGIHHEHNANRM